MDQPSGPIQPDRIRLARELRGLTQQQVVERMAKRITVPALSQIEAGKVRPAEETASDLANALEVPREFFAMPLSGHGLEGPAPATFFRHLRATPSRERRRAAALAVLLRDFIEAISVHVRLPEVSIPRAVTKDGAAGVDVERSAELVRSEWNLGEEPIPHVVRELERHGVAVARLTMGHEAVDAFSVGFADRPLVLLARDKSNYVRSRFDAAHELGHLVMHVAIESGDATHEAQAHDFAAAFLLPRRVAQRYLPRQLDGGGWRQLAQLKRIWGISIAALLYRSRALGLVSEERYRNAMRYMSSMGWRRTEPGDREMGPPEAPMLLERSIRAIETQSGVRLEDLIRFANVPAADTLELIEAATDQRPAVEL